MSDKMRCNYFLNAFINVWKVNLINYSGKYIFVITMILNYHV